MEQQSPTTRKAGPAPKLGSIDFARALPETVCAMRRKMAFARLLVSAGLLVTLTGCDDEPAEQARRSGSRTSDAAAEASGFAREDAAVTVCDGESTAPRTAPDVALIDVHGSIAGLTREQRRSFCEWLWDLPDYGEHHCCAGVVRPLRIAVQDDSSRERCADDLAIFEKCPQVRIEAYAECAVAKLTRFCGTPLGCSALSNDGQTAVCLAR